MTKPASVPSPDEVERLKTEVADLTNKWKRAAADYINLTKRIERERAQLTEGANLDLLRRLLPIVDGLEKAVAHLQDQGLNLVWEKLRYLLQEVGLAEMATSGQFDPRFHECVEMVTGGQAGEIAETLDKGFIINEKVVRAARVRVFSGPAKISQEGADL